MSTSPLLTDFGVGKCCPQCGGSREAPCTNWTDAAAELVPDLLAACEGIGAALTGVRDEISAAAEVDTAWADVNIEADRVLAVLGKAKGARRLGKVAVRS